MPTPAERRAAALDGKRVLETFWSEVTADNGTRCEGDWSRYVDKHGVTWHVSPCGGKLHKESLGREFTDPVTLRPWWVLEDGSWHWGPWLAKDDGRLATLRRAPKAPFDVRIFK